MDMKHIEKIAKLIALANDKTASEGERNNAKTFADRMMAQYNLDQATVLEKVKASTPGREKCRLMTVECQNFGNMHAINHRVAGAIARYTDVKYFYVKGDHMFTFFGLPSDVILARFIFESLQAQIFPAYDQFEMSEAYSKARLDGDHPSTIRSSFRQGWELEVAEKLYKMWQDKNELQDMDKSRALVVVKNELIVADFADTGIKLKSGGERYKSASSSEGLRAGRKAGREVGIGSAAIDAPRGRISHDKE